MVVFYSYNDYTAQYQHDSKCCFGFPAYRRVGLLETHSTLKVVLVS